MDPRSHPVLGDVDAFEAEGVATSRPSPCRRQAQGQLDNRCRRHDHCRHPHVPQTLRPGKQEGHPSEAAPDLVVRRAAHHRGHERPGRGCRESEPTAGPWRTFVPPSRSRRAHVQRPQQERPPRPLRGLAVAGRRARGRPPLAHDAGGEGGLDADHVVQGGVPGRLRQHPPHSFPDPARQPHRPRTGRACQRRPGSRREVPPWHPDRVHLQSPQPRPRHPRLRGSRSGGPVLDLAGHAWSGGDERPQADSRLRGDRACRVARVGHPEVLRLPGRRGDGAALVPHPNHLRRGSEAQCRHRTRSRSRIPGAEARPGIRGPDDQALPGRRRGGQGARPAQRLGPVGRLPDPGQPLQVPAAAVPGRHRRRNQRHHAVLQQPVQREERRAVPQGVVAIRHAAVRRGRLRLQQRRSSRSCCANGWDSRGHQHGLRRARQQRLRRRGAHAAAALREGRQGGRQHLLGQQQPAGTDRRGQPAPARGAGTQPFGRRTCSRRSSSSGCSRIPTPTPRRPRRSPTHPRRPPGPTRRTGSRSCSCATTRSCCR